jgi:hypothetical protein
MEDMEEIGVATIEETGVTTTIGVTKPTLKKNQLRI